VGKKEKNYFKTSITLRLGKRQHKKVDKNKKNLINLQTQV